MFDFDFTISCKGCSVSFEPDTYPVVNEKDKYCKKCRPAETDNDFMKGWDD